MKTIRRGLSNILLVRGLPLMVVASMAVANPAEEAATPPPPGQYGPGAHRHDWGSGGPGGPGAPHLFSQLGLSPEQQAAVKAIVTAAKPQMKSLHEQRRANHLKLAQTKPDDPNYGNVVAEVAQSEAALAGERTTQAAEMRVQMYALLTPAQKAQLATLQAQWANRPRHAPPGGVPSANVE